MANADSLGDGGTEDAGQTWELYRQRHCSHCGGCHARACPRVRKLEWHDNGKLASVEFWPRDRWSDDGILWPEDIPGDPPWPLQ